MRKLEILKGRGSVTVELPDAWNVFDVPMPDDIPLENPAEVLAESLKNPTGSPPLETLAQKGHRIVLCVTDVSRPCPDYILLPPVLERLDKAGVRREDITILIGVGEHRPVTVDEMKVKFGKAVVENYRILNHNAHDADNLIDLGTTAEGVPRVVNRLLTQADLIITAGVVDLHQYAGFSGGAKTIAVGCAGEASIKYTHSADFLDRSGAVPGRIEGNLFQQALWEIVKPLPFRFTVNVILNEEGRILALDSGDPMTVHQKMLDICRRKFIITVDRTFDYAILGVPHPKDVNLYQATRAATYQALSGSSVFNKGAVISIAAECPEKFGVGVGEERFRAMMMSETPSEILKKLTGKKSLPGEQRAFMVVKTMAANPINVWGSQIPDDELVSAGFLADPLIPPGAEDRPLNVLVMKDGQKKVVLLKG